MSSLYKKQLACVCFLVCMPDALFILCRNCMFSCVFVCLHVRVFPFRSFTMLTFDSKIW